MAALAHYTDVVAEVRSELLARVDEAVAAGVDPAQLVLDPGLGFAKRAEHNWSLLGHFSELTALGCPVLLGASRKSFLGRLLADENGIRPSDGREDATTALSMFAALNGAWGVRVHQVQPSVDAARAAAAIQAAR
jgi:dihydropteroate synthase